MKLTKIQLNEFAIFCKFIFAYAAMFCLVNILLLGKDFNISLVATSVVPALISYFGFAFLDKKK